MDKNVQQWLQCAKQVTLTPQEHAIALHTITQQAGLHLRTHAAVQAAVLNPLEKESIKAQLLTAIHTASLTAKRTHWFTLAWPRMQLVALACVFLMLLSASGSAVYAAEDALPGDNLYTIKTTITEPFLSHFYRSAPKRVEFEAWRYERRLQELQHITKDPALTTDARLEMALQNIEQHSVHLEQMLATLDDSEEVKPMREHLQERLEHKQVLIEQLQSGEIPLEQVERMRNKGRLPPRKPPFTTGAEPEFKKPRNFAVPTSPESINEAHRLELPARPPKLEFEQGAEQLMPPQNVPVNELPIDKHKQVDVQRIDQDERGLPVVPRRLPKLN